MDKLIVEDIENNLKGIIIEKYRPVEIKELGGYQNYIYDISKEDFRHFILRITQVTHRSKEELADEIKFLLKCAKNDVPVSRPLKYPYCELVESVKTDNNKYYITVFEKAKGLNWYETTTDDITYFNAGAALGKIHQISKTITEKYHRTSWENNQYIGELNNVIKDEIILRKKDELIDLLKTLNMNKNVYGLVHGDYNYANMTYEAKNVTVFDFDELEYNWYVYDIAVYLFYYLLGGNPAKIDIEPNIQLFKAFMKGYLGETYFDVQQAEQLPLFFRLREFILLSSLYRNEKVNAWGKAFIETAQYRIKNDLPFVNIDYVRLFKELL